MYFTGDIRQDVAQILEAAQRVSADVGKEVEAILHESHVDPLSDEELSRLLTTIINVVKRNAELRGDTALVEALAEDTEIMVKRLLKLRSGKTVAGVPLVNKRLALLSRNGIAVGPVFPNPVFHGKEVPMKSGFVKTTDISLWDQNERLDIHLSQFQKRSGRAPNAQELLDIMMSKMKLPGMTEDDPFKITDLARSIAINGVRKPPILDLDGTLLDGNRRVTACYFILNSSDDQFTADQKKRAEYIFCWQLTEHATDDDRHRVVVSLNFESDCKQDWPEYVKARKVYDEWQAMLALEGRPPGPQRQAQMKRELSMRYALGSETTVVGRYLKMVDWANEFEEHQINGRKKDVYEVKHQANRYFQYFDEMQKGVSPGGVADTLNKNESFRHLVFDLLFAGKFSNWRQIRSLKHAPSSQEAMEILQGARTEPDVELAQDRVDGALVIAAAKSAQNREIGANTRIEAFVKWLDELPMKAYRTSISRINLKRLVAALELAGTAAAKVLESEPDSDDNAE